MLSNIMFGTDTLNGQNGEVNEAHFMVYHLSVELGFHCI